MRPLKRITCILIFAGIASVAMNAQTAPQPATSTTAAKPSPVADEKKATPAPAAALPGMVVFKDPVTGQIRQPEASEIGDLVNSVPAASSATPPVSRAMTGVGGAPGMRLGQDSMIYMVLSKTADGKLVEECVTGDQAAAAKVASGAKPAGTVIRKGVPDVQ